MERPHEIYSHEFQSLISDSEAIKKLIEGSYLMGADFEAWEHERRFISDEFDRDGSILDVGCANGFFLRCIQEWSDHKFDAYGIDCESTSIDKAKELFPNNSENFSVLSMQDIKQLQREGLPDEYDFVYWNVWDNYEFKNTKEVRAITDLQRHVVAGGKLVLGFYDDDRSKNKTKIEKLQSLGIKFSKVVSNPNGNGMLAVIERY